MLGGNIGIQRGELYDANERQSQNPTCGAQMVQTLLWGSLLYIYLPRADVVVLLTFCATANATQGGVVYGNLPSCHGLRVLRCIRSAAARGSTSVGVGLRHGGYLFGYDEHVFVTSVRSTTDLLD